MALQLEYIRDKIDIIKILEVLKIEGKIRGKEFLCNCIFPDHEDKHPSFNISIEGKSKGIFHCFSCGAKGTIFHLVELILNINREDCEKFISKLFNIEIDSKNNDLNEMLFRLKFNKNDNLMNIDNDITFPLPKYKIKNEKLSNYLNSIRNYPTDKIEKIISDFDMYYCEKGYYNNRILIPIFDSYGNYRFFEATSCNPDIIKPKKLYPKGSKVGDYLFNLNNIKTDYCFICEGIWDVIRLYSFGYSAISTFGTNISINQAKLLIKHFNKIIILYDGDKAGYKGTDKIYSLLSNYIEVKYFKLLYGDPDDLTIKNFHDIIRILNVKI